MTEPELFAIVNSCRDQIAQGIANELGKDFTIHTTRWDEIIRNACLETYKLGVRDERAKTAPPSVAL
jgi:hypothetical protein